MVSTRWGLFGYNETFWGNLPGIVPYRWMLELVLPVAIVLVVLAPLRLALVSLFAIGLAQLVLLLVLGGVTLASVPAHFAAHPEADPTARAVGGTALLFIYYERVAVGPDRSVVIREWVARPLAVRHRAHTPAGLEAVPHQQVGHHNTALFGDDSAPRRWPRLEVKESIDRLSRSSPRA